MLTHKRFTIIIASTCIFALLLLIAWWSANLYILFIVIGVASALVSQADILLPTDQPSDLSINSVQILTKLPQLSAPQPNMSSEPMTEFSKASRYKAPILLTIGSISAVLSFSAWWFSYWHLFFPAIFIAVTLLSQIDFSALTDQIKLNVVFDKRTGAALLAVVLSSATLLTQEIDLYSPLSPILWVCSIAAALLSTALPQFSPRSLLNLQSWTQRLVKVSQNPDMLIGLGLFTVALILRIYALSSNASFVVDDEGKFGMFAQRLIEGTQKISWFAALYEGHPTLFHHIQALGVRLLGNTMAGVRLIGSVSGALEVVTIYALTRQYVGRVGALAAGIITGISHLELHYSRNAMSMVEAQLFGTLTMLCLMWALKRYSSLEKTSPRLFPFALTGGFLAFSLYFYFGSRLYPIVFGLILALMLIRRQVNLRQCLTVAFVALIVYAPQGMYFIKNPSQFSSRPDAVGVFSERRAKEILGANIRWPDATLNLLGEQINRNIGILWTRGDGSGFYSGDFVGFDHVSAIYIIAGILLTLLFIRTKGHIALIIWLLLGVGLGGVITDLAPNGPRLMMTFPVLFVMAGIATDKCYQWLTTTLFGKWQYVKPITAMLMILPLAWASYDNLNTYFVKVPAVMSRDVIALAENTIAVSPQSNDIYLIGFPNEAINHGAMTYVTHGSGYKRANTINEITRNPTKGLWVLISAGQPQTLTQLQQKYPNGKLGDYIDPRGRKLFFTYLLPAG